MALSGAQVTQHGLAGFSQVIYGDFTAKAGGPDVTAPTISSATLAADGNSITFACSESVEFGAGGNTGFVLVPTNGGAAVTLSYSSGSGSSDLVYATSRTASSTETFTYAYTNPGNGVQDAAGNALESFTAQAVTNNSAVNGTPTDLALSRTTVTVTGGLNAPVGTLSATDPDAGETFTYTLVVGDGDTDNASFDIDGATLRCDDPATLGVSARSVRIRVTDSANNTREEAFTINVIDATFSLLSSVSSVVTSTATSRI